MHGNFLCLFGAKASNIAVVGTNFNFFIYDMVGAKYWGLALGIKAKHPTLGTIEPLYHIWASNPKTSLAKRMHFILCHGRGLQLQ